jgi:hypothetical protein
MLNSPAHKIPKLYVHGIVHINTSARLSGKGLLFSAFWLSVSSDLFLNFILAECFFVSLCCVQVDVELARQIAGSKLRDEEMQKKLWLKVAQHVIRKENDIAK